MGLDNSFEVADTLEWLAGSGLIGLECYYSAYSSEQRAGYVELARRFQLIPSGGSDYHGSYKTGISIGSGGGDLAVPDGVLEELRSVRP
jgi:predicted metal-dependent phosphoesterase TrpH